MAFRYRFSIDIIDKDDVLNSADIADIIDAARAAAKINIPAEKKRSVRVVSPRGTAGSFHAHYGNSSCNGCYRSGDDGLDSDNIEDEFQTVSL